MRLNDVDRMFYNINELSTVLSLTEASIRSKIYRNQIPTVKLGGRVLIPAMFVDKLLNRINKEVSITMSDRF